VKSWPGFLLDFLVHNMSLLQNPKFELIYFAKRCKKEKQAAIFGTMESTKTTP